MTRSLGSLLVLGALVLAACGGEGGISSGCVDPPPEQLMSSTEVVLTLDPNPVAAGADADLSVSAVESISGQVVVGAAVFWQCWDGSAWVDTHQLLRGHYGDYRLTELQPDVTVTMPAVGLIVPNTFSIQIPDVPAGTYRIVDRIHPGDGEATDAALIVRVE